MGCGWGEGKAEVGAAAAADADASEAGGDQGARPRSATKELGGPRRGGGGPRRARVVFLPSMAASASHPWRATPLSPRSRFVSRLLT